LSTKSDDLITVTPVATVKTVDLTEAAVRLHPADEVAVARVPLAPGLRLRMDAGVVRVGRLIPSGHKVALRPVAVGDAVHKYGQVIGFATMPIAPGDHAHSHNLGVGSLTHDYAIGVDVKPVAYAPESARRAFMGFRRPDGRAGTRNYVAVISTVNCSASTVRAIADRFRPGASGGDILRDYPTVDGIIGLTHKGGCGARYGSREIDLLQRTLAGVARHPNVAAYVFVGLGCEINQIQDLVSAQGLEQDRPPLLVIQDEGGLQETVEAGVAAVKELLPLAAAYKREEIPASELVVALQCGGSDGWSGVTANPALGRAADLLVRQGGTVALGETPEVYGAEHMLTRRAAAPAVAERLLERIHWWEEYTRRNGCEIDNNPSPGNKLGGLTTIYEKSLGAVAKGGSTPLAGVYEYAERIAARGFVHVDTPGYDPISVTGQVASGCTMVVFTTGRGSVFGCKPAPSIKVATNSALYQKMRNDMDVDAGRVLDGATLDEVGEEIFARILAVASGERSKSERHGIGEEEFNPWIIGATL